MTRLYGNPQKFIRHVTEESSSIGYQAAKIFNFWRCDTGAAIRS